VSLLLVLPFYWCASEFAIDWPRQRFLNLLPYIRIQIGLGALGENMVGGLKVLTVKARREKEFEALFTALRDEMHQQEPGCLLYWLLKSRKSSSDYIVHE
jgi:hypothetical protein